MALVSDDLFIKFGDFNGSPNTYTNKALNQRFRVLLDRHIVLEPGVEWDKLTSGGFIVTIPGWSVAVDTVIVVQFY